MLQKVIIVFLLLSDVHITTSQESAHYLQSAMWNLENRPGGGIQTRRRLDPLQVKSTELISKDISQQNVPMLSLTKGELAALYEAVVVKQSNFAGSHPDESSNSYMNTIVHEIQEDPEPLHHKLPDLDHSDHLVDSSNGYYYYYYPINTFMDSVSSPSSHDHSSSEMQHLTDAEKLHAQYHAHTHQHNVHITSNKNAPEGEKKKIMEPLFMAVSSFIGMAVMFVLSILFLPKFSTPKSRGVKQGSNDLTHFSQVVFKVIDGYDCSERIACELGKSAKAFRVQDSRFTKLLRRISPAYVGWYVDGMEKYAHTNLTCGAIQCRRKNL